MIRNYLTLTASIILLLSLTSCTSDKKIGGTVAGGATGVIVGGAAAGRGGAVAGAVGGAVVGRKLAK